MLHHNHEKYITFQQFTKLTSENFDAKLTAKDDITDIIDWNNRFRLKIEKLIAKVELKVEQEKIKKHMVQVFLSGEKIRT